MGLAPLSTPMELETREKKQSNFITPFQPSIIPVCKFQASRSGYFKAPHRWLILELDDDADEDTNKTNAVFNNLDILTDSDVVLAKKDEKGGYRMSEGITTYNCNLGCVC